MDREILFRGKRTDNNKWVYGLFCECPCDDGTDIPSIMRIENKESDRFFMQYPIISETRGQYTGLTDRNGVKIFEGDIVTGTAYSFERIGVIVWIDEIAGFGILYPKREEAAAWENTSILKCLSKGRSDQFAAAVIGNIHDNPELIDSIKI